MQKNIIELYNEKKKNIKLRLDDFKKLDETDQFKEMLFCILTPQSNAKKCWQAVVEISLLNNWNRENISAILRKHTRFHNNKTKYILAAGATWNSIKNELNMQDRIKLRNFVAEQVAGYGLKEASHFLRNIGKSENKIAILDRHILRNLKELNVIESDKIKSRKNYFEIEKKFISFSREMNIPIDELDLLFWSKENGEIFK
jgi:N-glycosylase/DNA lyase